MQLTVPEATLRWADGDTHGLVAMPLTDGLLQPEPDLTRFVDDAPR